MIFRGIYAILCSRNNKIYIGQAMGVRGCDGRIANHVRYLRNHKHGNAHLQAAWDNYGPSAFSFVRLQECTTRKDADRTEISLIREYNTDHPDFGFNMSPGGEQSPMLNPITHAKQKATQNSPEFRRRRSELLRVSHNRPETRARLRAALLKGYSGAAGERRRAKLRRSLIKAYKDPAVRARNAALRRKEWAQDPARKAQFIATVKAYHLRRKQSLIA